jgi:DNA-directed RNA polymerase subunit RPC12/RpoP
VHCANCKREFPTGARRKAGISITNIGDEYIYSYWQCEECNFYTVELYRDVHLGVPEISILPAMTKEDGDLAVLRIKTCPDPHNVDCECEYHQRAYGIRRSEA